MARQRGVPDEPLPEIDLVFSVINEGVALLLGVLSSGLPIMTKAVFGGNTDATLATLWLAVGFFIAIFTQMTLDRLSKRSAYDAKTEWDKIRRLSSWTVYDVSCYYLLSIIVWFIVESDLSMLFAVLVVFICVFFCKVKARLYVPAHEPIKQ